MTASTLGIIALLACMAATSVAQQPPSDTENLDEVTVVGRTEQARSRGPGSLIFPANNATLRLEGKVGVQLNLVQKQSQVVFRRTSAARQLPEAGSELSRINGRLHLEVLPDRLIASWPYLGDGGYLLAANVDEADGLPAYIPFGAGVALVNLDYVSLRDNQRKTRITLANAMHPQTRKCESELAIYDLWPDGSNPYVLLGNSLRSCVSAIKRREGDLLFAENVPGELRQAVQELYDPIAARLANRLGSEPGNLYVAWWPDSPHDGYRLQLSWNRNSLLLFNGSGWQQGLDAAQRESLRLSFMREQIQRRIRESDWPGPFTQSAVSYLLLLTRSQEDQTTPQRLSQELPLWIAGCADRIQHRTDTGNREQGVASLECGLVLQFVYDAVARSSSAGKQDIYDTWRKLLDASFRRKKSEPKRTDWDSKATTAVRLAQERVEGSGAKPADFLASSTDALRIAQGLVDGSIDWQKFAAALEGVGVKLQAISGGTLPMFEVRSLEHFQD